MASFPLYDTFFYYLTQKSSLFVQLFRKKWEKSGASTKKLFDTPLKPPYPLGCDDITHFPKLQALKLNNVDTTADCILLEIFGVIFVLIKKTSIY